MADARQLEMLRRDVGEWNRWRAQCPGVMPDLQQADLTKAGLAGAHLEDANLAGAILTEADLSGAFLDRAKLCCAEEVDGQVRAVTLSRTAEGGINIGGRKIVFANMQGAILKGTTLIAADISGANLIKADLSAAHLEQSNLTWTNLTGAHLNQAKCNGADFLGAFLTEADCTGADFSHALLDEAKLERALLVNSNLVAADLSRASLVGAAISGAHLDSAKVYGVSAWDVKGDPASQQDLEISRFDESKVTVDNLEVAQFVYLLLSNPKIRNAIDTVCKKGVLILGRFSEDRKRVLDALRVALRQGGWVPMIFDFEKPTERDFTETIKTMAGMSHFIIADITNPRSSPLELQATVPDYMVPLVAIIEKGEEPFSMFRNLWEKYRWVLDPLEYSSIDELVGIIQPAIIEPAQQKHAELLAAKAHKMRTRSAADYASK